MPNSDKIEFDGANGHRLAARLDMPAGPPRAYALFAHCFTCSKETLAATRIAAGLAERGFAVLRFDFTGLGGSEGEFANTNFSSNIADLLAAAAHLRDHHEAPALLVGHSLGGAAVLAAAGDIPEVKAVATIGAPADAGHVANQFGAKLDEIAERGMAEVELAGRRFTVKKQFLDDLEQHALSDAIAGLRRALLVMHGPRDEVVSIDNASRIFSAAKHPKSFISLDDADHMLRRREDAAYVAEVLSAWASRYVGAAEHAHGLAFPGPAGVVSVAETGYGKFQQVVVAGGHRLTADEPVDYGGLDSGPSPYDFLSIGLAACTAMTMRLYAERKGLPLARVAVHVRHGKVHAKDCLDCGEGREGQVDRFERELEIEGDLGEEARARLVEIAGRCPVHRTLEAGSAVVTRVKDTKSS